MPATDAARVDFGADKQTTVRQENREARAVKGVAPSDDSGGACYAANARNLEAISLKDTALDADYSHIGDVQKAYGR